MTGAANTPGATPHRARKRFGQHFLHDPSVIGRIVKAIAPRPGDQVIEIGPGLGALTSPLLEKLGAIQVVELDRDVLPHLRGVCAGKGELTVHQADALKFDFAKLADHGAKLRLVGNLPYNISSPLLFHLLEYAASIRDMHFMLQKEVVDRMVAAPGEKAYGRLSASLAARVRCDYLFRVKPGAFTPPPKVDSAVVRLTPCQPDFRIENPLYYQRVLDAAFGMRRKTLGNALKRLCSREQIAASGIDPGLRAERISPAEFAALANHLHQQGCPLGDQPGNR